MNKTVLLLSLLLAVPVASQKVRPPTPEEMRLTIRNLEETVEEQEERLRVHKLEIEALRKTVLALESRLASLEQNVANRQAPAAETAHR